MSTSSKPLLAPESLIVPTIEPLMGATYDSAQPKRSLAIWVNRVEVPRKVHSTALSQTEQVFYKEIISKLVARRKYLGISQEELCSTLGVSEGLVNKWEAGVKLPGCFWLMCWCISLGLKLNIEAKDSTE
jgi:DNA-binding transcriptional regulator YiaG